MSDNNQELQFLPYGPNEERRGRAVGKDGRNPYTPEEDQRILEAIAMGDEAGIPRSPVFMKLAEEFEGRNAKAIEAHFYALRKKLDGDDTDDDEEEDDDSDTSIFDRLKTIVKERDYYKSKYDGMKDDYDSMKAENDKLRKEMKQIRRLLG